MNYKIMKFSELNNGDLFKYGKDIFKKIPTVKNERGLVIANCEIVDLPKGRISEFIEFTDNVTVKKIGVAC